MMMVGVHQLLKLVLLLFVVNLPSCWSLCDISAARRDAHRGGCQMLNKCSKFAESIARNAAEQAGVLSPSVVEAYKGRTGDDDDDSDDDDDDDTKVCLLFSAWSNECISHLMHCVASLEGRQEIDVSCTRVSQANGFFKSGGFSYISKETDELLLAYEFDEVIGKHAVFRWGPTPTRVLDKVNADPFCLSAVDSERPGYYLIHRNGKLLYEPEYAPTNPDTFDEDASFFVKPDAYFQGFAALESYNLPNHFAIANTTSNQIELSEFKDTEEFRISASVMTISSATKELFPCSSCEEIKKLDDSARSGLYIIKSSDGTLGQVDCEMGDRGMLGRR